MKNNIKLEITKTGLLLNGEPFYLASGDMHYFRFFKGGWKRRLELLKDFGLNAVQTYVPWNAHEPEKGKFCFGENLDLSEFLKLCQEVGLYVLLRPSPYICSEWDFGGIPYWLLNEPDISIRSSCEIFMKHVKEYYARLAKEFIPHLSTNGGPIIAVAVENEYGSFSNDKLYLKELGDILKEEGVDVPLYTSDGGTKKMLINGSYPDYLTGVNFHHFNSEVEKNFKEVSPDTIVFAPEFYPGRAQQWGVYFDRQKPKDLAEIYKQTLDKGIYVDFYMFCGGTNFGFRNGGIKAINEYTDNKPKYVPYCTSYDVDALVSEEGHPTEKYFECKKVLKEYKEKMGIKDTSSPKTKDDYNFKTQKPDDVVFKDCADFLSNCENIAEKTVFSSAPKSFESLGQDYGFVLYRKHIDKFDDFKRRIRISELYDRAIIFINGKYLDTLRRDFKTESEIFDVAQDGVLVEILVENLGRICQNMSIMNNRRGILDFVTLEIMDDNGEKISDFGTEAGWTNYSLPLCDLSNIDFTKKATDDRPGFYAGSFKAEKGVDTFINPEGWTKGVIWINGFNLGRYWNIGPQGTLYVPGELIKEENTITILELHQAKKDKTMSFSHKPMIDMEIKKGF